MFILEVQYWQETNMLPLLITADRSVTLGLTYGLTCSMHCSVIQCHCLSVFVSGVLPLGCWTHCHSNCCRADFSCTSLKLIALHSIHFRNMCSNYYFERVIIKWESVGNEREEMANIPGIATSALIMPEIDWLSFLESVSTSIYLKKMKLSDCTF